MGPKITTNEFSLRSSSPSDPISLEEAFELGAELEYLQGEGINDEIGEPTDDKIISSLQRTRGLLDSVSLDTSNISGEVSSFESKLNSKYEPEDTLSSEDVEELERKVISWFNLLERELGSERRLPISHSGVLDVEKLSESPEDLFSPLVWNWLDDRPKQDIKEGCQSLIIGSSTACVMLSLRAVEHCLREWHKEKSGESLEAAWGHVLDQLIEEHLGDVKQEGTVLEQLSKLPPVLSNLYYLKEKRNEVNHPQKSPDGREANRTLMVVVSTIREIFEEHVNEWEIDYRGETVTIPAEIIEKKELLYRAILEIEAVVEEPIQEEALSRAAFQLDLSTREITNLVRELKREGRIYVPEEGEIRPIDTV